MFSLAQEDPMAAARGMEGHPPAIVVAEAAYPWGDDNVITDVGLLTGEQKTWFAKQLLEHGNSAAKLAKRFPTLKRKTIYDWASQVKKGRDLHDGPGRPRGEGYVPRKNSGDRARADCLQTAYPWGEEAAVTDVNALTGEQKGWFVTQITEGGNSAAKLARRFPALNRKTICEWVRHVRQGEVLHNSNGRPRMLDDESVKFVRTFCDFNGTEDAEALASQIRVCYRKTQAKRGREIGAPGDGTNDMSERSVKRYVQLFIEGTVAVTGSGSSSSADPDAAATEAPAEAPSSSSSGVLALALPLPITVAVQAAVAAADLDAASTSSTPTSVGKA
jgi:transposase